MDFLTGDLENFGNYRIEFYNAWGDTANDSPIGDNLGVTFSNELVISFTLSGTNYGAQPEPEELPPVEYSGEYFAGIGVQTAPSYIFRNTYGDASYGYLTNYDYFMEGLHTVGDNAESYAGTFSDVMINGDGTYTVALTGADFGSDFEFHMLFVTTGIPFSNQLTFSDVSITINGKDAGYFKDGFDLIKSDNKDYFDIMLQNDYNTSQTNIISLPTEGPVTDISVTFTVSGMGYEGTPENEKGEPEAEPTAAPTTAPTNAPTTAPDDTTGGSSSNAPLIIGLCIGGVVLVAAAITAIIIIRKKRG